jgi:TonB family protein
MSIRIQTCSVVVLMMLIMATTSEGQQTLTARNTSFQPQPVSDVVENDRVKDGLIGPVRRVRTEVVKLTTLDGRVTEGKRSLLEVVAYDVKGRKIENQYFPVAGGTLTGKEVYKYDEKGNISEMTLLNDDGTLLSKEVYRYEFDFAGNWSKMITSVAVVDGGRVSLEPTEVTYRSIMYYLTENMAKMFQPKSASQAAPPATPVNSTKAVTEPKPLQVASPTIIEQVTDQMITSLPSSAFKPGNVSESNEAEASSASRVNEEKSPQIVFESEPPPPVELAKPILKPVSGGVLNGTALKLPAPVYPETAKRLKISGVVSIAVVVDEIGKVIAAEATSGPVSLRESALQAALRARFSPTKLSGQPVKVSGVINYRFTLAL